MKYLQATIALLLNLVSTAHAQPASPINLIIFPGGLSWPVFVAQDKGFFENEKLAVKVKETPGPPMTGWRILHIAPKLPTSTPLISQTRNARSSKTAD